MEEHQQPEKEHNRQLETRARQAYIHWKHFSMIICLEQKSEFQQRSLNLSHILSFFEATSKKGREFQLFTIGRERIDPVYEEKRAKKPYSRASY